MTEKEMRCVKALRICHSNEDCRDCEFMEADRDENSCVNILFEESADLIESLSERLEAAQPKWISTKDRLPEEPGGILICAFGSIVTFATLKENGVLVTKNYDVWNINDSCVTHWMPLPEPPKEDKGE